MPVTRRPAYAVPAGGALLVALALVVVLPAEGQDGQEAAPVSVEFHAALTLATDPELRPLLQAVPDYVEQRSWPQVARLLQALLDAREDSFTIARPKARPGKPDARWTGVWAEAERRLAGLPAQGLASYEALFGARAKSLLADAKKNSDPERLAAVARRYFCTAAGAEAAELVGTWHLDRGRHPQAALWFRRLLGHPRADRLAPLTLFRACLAFRRAGDEAGARQTWERIAKRAPGGLHLGERLVSLTELRRGLDRPVAAEPTPAPAPDWRMFRRDPARGGEGPGAIALLENRWQRPTAFTANPRAWVESAVDKQATRFRPVLPAFFPVVAAGKVIYRSHAGIHAADVATGKVAWEVVASGSLEKIAGEAAQLPYVHAWVTGYLADHPHVLFENSALGALSTDGHRVYAVDGLAVPPYLNPQLAGGKRGLRQWLDQLDLVAEVGDLAYHSKLLAIDLATGRVVWERGGASAKPGRGPRERYFLGPPLPLDGRLYALAEEDQELHLVCLEPTGADLAWRLKLGTVHLKTLLDPRRRLEATHLAYADGVLVCPTNAGAVVGVDLLTHGLRWAYPYRESTPAADSDPPFPLRGRWRVPTPDLNAQWQTSAPVIHDGKVIFTAPDSPRVHCLDLRDGAPRWTAPRDADDLYLADVSRGQVLLVGKENCRALALADGRERWRVKTGQPSGQGFASGGVYYLPLKRAAKEGKPAVYGIDLERGEVVSRTLTPKGASPGNLVGSAGRVVSQTATDIALFAGQKVSGD
jgi:hypothetical protein